MAAVLASHAVLASRPAFTGGKRGNGKRTRPNAARAAPTRGRGRGTIWLLRVGTIAYLSENLPGKEWRQAPFRNSWRRTGNFCCFPVQNTPLSKSLLSDRRDCHIPLRPWLASLQGRPFLFLGAGRSAVVTIGNKEARQRWRAEVGREEVTPLRAPEGLCAHINRVVKRLLENSCVSFRPYRQPATRAATRRQ